MSSASRQIENMARTLIEQRERADRAEQERDELADALREIASLPAQSEDWHENDVAVRVARAALDRHTRGQT